MKQENTETPGDAAVAKSSDLLTLGASSRPCVDPLLYLTTGTGSSTSAESIKRMATGRDGASKARALECSPGPTQTALLKKLMGDLAGKLIPAPPNEITINAELLYNYVGVYAISPLEYVESLKAMGGVFDPLKGRLYKGLDGQPALNCALALQVSGPAYRRFPGAVVCLILLEAVSLEESERQPDFVDRKLRHWLPLAVAGHTAARYLHHYLEVEEDYDRWIAGHMKRFGMKLNGDYHVADCGDGSRGSKDGPVMSGKEWVVTATMAGEIVKIERTARAAQIISLWKES